MSGIMQTKPVGVEPTKPIHAVPGSHVLTSIPQPIQAEPFGAAQHRLRRPSRRSCLPRSSRGQALLEYSLVAHALLLGGVVFTWPFLVYLMNALSLYFKSIYFVVSSPVP